MGTWGYKPLDSDSAHDAMHVATKNLVKAVHKAATQKDRRRLNYYGQEARAALLSLTVLHRAGVYVDDDVFEEGEKFLKDMLADERWLGGWREPTKIRRALRTELRRTQRVIAQNRARNEEREKSLARGKALFARGGARGKRRKKRR